MEAVMRKTLIVVAAVLVALGLMGLTPAGAGPRANLTQDHAGGYGLTNCPEGSESWCVMNAAGDEVANTVHIDGAFTPPADEGFNTSGDATGGVSHRYRVRGTETVTGKFALTITKRDIENLGDGYAFVLARFCVSSGFDNECRWINVDPGAEACTIEAELTFTKDRLRRVWQSTALLGYAAKPDNPLTPLPPDIDGGRFDADGTLVMEAFPGPSDKAGEVVSTCSAAALVGI